MEGDGFTVMVNVSGVPGQVGVPLLKEGVIVMVAVTGLAPALTALKAPILPVPLAPKPILELLFVQE